jgi:hypothetical protein
MIKATTIHGTYYLIDEENMRAIRVRPENRQDVYSNTEGWFNYFTFSGAKIGKPMQFYLEYTDHNPFDWQISTPVVSIEEIEDE